MIANKNENIGLNIDSLFNSSCRWQVSVTSQTHHAALIRCGARIIRILLLIDSWTWKRWERTGTRPTTSRTPSGRWLSFTSYVTSASTRVAPSRTRTSRTRSRCDASPCSTCLTWSCLVLSLRSSRCSASTSQATPARRCRWASPRCYRWLYFWCWWLKTCRPHRTFCRSSVRKPRVVIQNLKFEYSAKITVICRLWVIDLISGTTLIRKCRLQATLMCDFVRTNNNNNHHKITATTTTMTTMMMITKNYLS